MCLKGYDIPKVWFRFSKHINGKNIRFRWEQLPKHRFEEFIDFKMNYYVKHEITHVVAGVLKSPDAMAEYREIMVNQYYNNPSLYPSICCVDDETNEMIACNALMLYRRGETNRNTMQAKTTEVKKFYKILHEWNNLCRVDDVMIKYKADKCLDDDGAAIRPDYRGYRINATVSLMREITCMANAIPLTGAWMTDIRTQLTTSRLGWEPIYEITCEELEKKLGVKFQNAPPTFVYNVKTVGKYPSWKDIPAFKQI